MLECWASEPMERPSFSKLEAALGLMLGNAEKQVIEITKNKYFDVFFFLFSFLITFMYHPLDYFLVIFKYSM